MPQFVAKIRPGDFILVLVMWLPLVFAWHRLQRFFGHDLGDSLLTLGRAAGIVGLSTILIAGIVSVRLPKVDGVFGGLTRLWKLHHLLGFAGFVLVLIHVELVAISALPISRELPARILFPSLSDNRVWLGWFSLGALTVFLAPSFKFFGPPHYQDWKLLHMIAAPTALLLAVLHATALSHQPNIWWLFGGLALLAVAWRRAGSKLVGRLPYTVREVQRLAPDVVELSLEAEGRSLKYAAGQFVYLTPTDSSLKAGRLEEHPFSLSSSPQEQVLRLGIKDFGDASHALQQVREGSRIWIEGPYGDFFARGFPKRNQLWLGGGIGITPMVGGARAMASRGTAPPGGVHLFYLADSAERAFYRTILLDCAKRTEGFDLTEHYFSREGAMTPEFLSGHCPDFREREVYLCGPPPMLAYFHRILREQGIPGSRIHSEEFTFL